LTHCLSFLCVLTKIWCVKYAVTPLNGNAVPVEFNHNVKSTIFRVGYQLTTWRRDVIM